ncbi:MAG: AAA family ATPase [Methanobrevibacter sp.]|jgi:hypothetical protein|nr:AAA family ATPase [Methanobrevibacter sp.]
MDYNKTCYFLSRPRRFGKTLFLSTLENFFKGRKELFKNTYIYDNWDDWEEYPVLRIVISDLLNNSSINLENNILTLIERIAKKNSIDLVEKKLYTSKFGELIEELSEL